LFYVISKNPESIFEEEGKIRTAKKVYSIQYKHGYPFFTFYEKGQWIIRSAKHYIPIDENRIRCGHVYLDKM
jgi:hypothetical protein